MNTPPPEKQLIRFDWAIKTLLREKANFDVLEGFLSALLNETILVEQILESEANAEENRKYNRVDLLVQDFKGRKLIIEVQNQREADYLERLLFGTAKVIVDNLPLGEKYQQVVKVISISILYFNLGVGDDYVYYGTTEFRGIHTQHPLKIRERVALPNASFQLRSKDIFPEYYLINVERFQDVIESPLDEWIYLLKHAAVRDDFHATNIERAREKMALLRMTPEERRRYERYVEAIVIERDVIETAKTEGLMEGRAEGLVQGRLEGEIALLRKQMKRKFGSLPEWAEVQLHNATPQQLDVWAEHILTVNTLSELLQPEKSGQ